MIGTVEIITLMIRQQYEERYNTPLRTLKDVVNEENCPEEELNQPLSHQRHIVISVYHRRQPEHPRPGSSCINQIVHRSDAPAIEDEDQPGKRLREQIGHERTLSP